MYHRKVPCTYFNIDIIIAQPHHGGNGATMTKKKGGASQVMHTAKCTATLTGLTLSPLRSFFQKVFPHARLKWCSAALKKCKSFEQRD